MGKKGKVSSVRTSGAANEREKRRQRQRARPEPYGKSLKKVGQQMRVVMAEGKGREL